MCNGVGRCSISRIPAQYDPGGGTESGRRSMCAWTARSAMR